MKTIPVYWYQNIQPAYAEPLNLTASYDSLLYYTYDNYEAIEVKSIKDIPNDYYGVMGVPLSFYIKYNPQQFEIVGICENLDLYGLKTKTYTAKECRDAYYAKFGRKGVYDLNAGGVINTDGRLEKVYVRLLIRRKH